MNPRQRHVLRIQMPLDAVGKNQRGGGHLPRMPIFSPRICRLGSANGTSIATSQPTRSRSASSTSTKQRWQGQDIARFASAAPKASIKIPCHTSASMQCLSPLVSRHVDPTPSLRTGPTHSTTKRRSQPRSEVLDESPHDRDTLDLRLQPLTQCRLLISLGESVKQLHS